MSVPLSVIVFFLLAIPLAGGYLFAKYFFPRAEFRRLAKGKNLDRSESNLLREIAEASSEESSYPLFFSRRRFRASALNYMDALRKELEGGKALEHRLQEVFKLEEKLFASRGPKRHSTRDFPINQPLHLHPHNAPRKRFHGAIWKKNRMGIGILYDDGGEKGLLHAGDCIDIHFQLPEEGVIHITATIEKLTEKPAPMLVIRHQEGLLKEKQRREYIRTSTRLYFTGRCIAEEEEENDTAISDALIPHDREEQEETPELPNSFKGEVIDMSAGGLRFTTETVLKDGNLFLFDVKLPAYTVRNILAKIISVHIGKRRGVYIYHADFIGINRKKSEMISAYVVEQELAEYNNTSDKKESNTHAEKESS